MAENRVTAATFATVGAVVTVCGVALAVLTARAATTWTGPGLFGFALLPAASAATLRLVGAGTAAAGLACLVAAAWLWRYGD